MNNTKFFINILLLFLLGFSATAQTKNIQLKGTVIDNVTKQPIEGAVVNILGEVVTIVTDNTGEFALEIPNANAKIAIWSPGYYSQEVPVLNRTFVEVYMVPESNTNFTESFVSPFYGETSSSEQNSLIKSFNKHQFSLNTTEVEQLFLKIPGMRVLQKSGMGGEGSEFYQRGHSTLIGNSTPLVVINGVPMTYNQNESLVLEGFSKGIFSMMNAKDIQNVTVLSGAEGGIYGSRASNGVILIETDKATAFETTVNFEGQYGISFKPKSFPVLGVDGYRKLIGDVGMTEYENMSEFIEDFPFLVDDPTDPNYYWRYRYNDNTDWQSYLYRIGFQTDNHLKIQGGDEIARYDFSFGYKGFQASLEETSYDRYYARINSDLALSNKFTMLAGVAAGYADNYVMEQGMSLETNPIMAALRKGPIFSAYEKDPDNNYQPDYASIRDDNGNLRKYNMVSNPLALLNLVTAKSKTFDINIHAGLNFQWNQYLDIKALFGLYYTMDRENLFVPGVTETSIMPYVPTNSSVAQNTVRTGIAETYNTFYSLNATYARTLNYVHDLRGSIAGQFSINSNEYDAAYGKNTNSDWFTTISNTNSVGRYFMGYNEKWNWMNLNANVRYIYNSTVGANVSLAYDGASSIGNDADRLHLYPSANIALYAKNLEFLKDENWINRLTLVADYTTTGNSQFSSNLSKYTYTSKRVNAISGIVRRGIPNTKLKPEINRTITFGVESSFLDNRLDVSLNVYQSKLSNVIIPQNLSPVYGYKEVYKNDAKIENKGIELAFQGTILQSKDLSWSVGATYTKNKNKVTSLGGKNEIINELSDGSAIITRVGESMYNFYGYMFNGVYNNTLEAEATGYTTAGGVAFGAGDVKWTDFNGDKIIDDSDRVLIGSAEPKYFGTFFTNFRYKNLNMSATFGYSYGNKAYNAVRREMESMKDYGNQLVSVSQRWFYEGQVTDMPKATYGDPLGNSRFSDRWIEDASYLKLKELVVSYDFPYLNGITVYAAGENLFTVTNYLGADPEFSYSYNTIYQGIDYAKLAVARTVKLGLRVKF